jgi:hypothetical protein
MYSHFALAGLLLSATTALANLDFSHHSNLAKRLDVSWGPIVYLGPTQSKTPIISTTTTIYPGKMPSSQTGYMFAWLGISNGTGDLVQSIVGSYPKGQSECTGPNADTTWCISSEVYGLDKTGATVQFVGEKTTADVNYENGIRLNYTLVDKESYLWVQTMHDAVTGELLSTYNKTSGPMTDWNTAIELQPYNGQNPVGTTEPQYYVNTTIVLETADSSFSQTGTTTDGAKYTELETSDNGKTWTIAKITIPAMQ